MKTLFTCLATALLLAVLAGCATSPVKRAEKMLTQSGFKPVPIATEAQQAQITALPPDRISPVKKNGKVFFVYPDPARKTVYVGTKSQLQAFKQAVSDLRLEQDAEMERDLMHARETNEDIDAQSGAMPSFEQIWEGWPDGE